MEKVYKMRETDRYEVLRSVFIATTIIGLYAFGIYACSKTKDLNNYKNNSLEHKTNNMHLERRIR